MTGDIRQPSHLDPEQDVEHYGVGYKTPSSYQDPEQDVEYYGVGYETSSSYLDPEQDVEYYGVGYKAAITSGPRAGCEILWCGI